MESENIKDHAQVSSIAKLRWQCRRGMLELDLLLNLFLEKDFDLLSETNQQYFVKLLSFPDQVLYHWILNPGLCLEFKHILEKINKHANARILSESLEEA